MQSIRAGSILLIPKTREETLTFISNLPPEHRAQVSPSYLLLLEKSKPVDPWVHGFTVALDEAGAIGSCSFKGPPDTEGVVEIAYAIDPEHQNKGYATEAASAITQFAFGFADVNIVRAHTLPENNASSHVLRKCGFQYLGEVMDPEDGRIWRWEIRDGAR